MPPSAFTAQVNRATAERAQDVALSEGLAPLQLWVKHLIDRVLAEGKIGAEAEVVERLLDQIRPMYAAPVGYISTEPPAPPPPRDKRGRYYEDLIGPWVSR